MEKLLHKVTVVTALAFGVCVAALLSAGCGIGPKWRPPIQFQAGGVDLKGKTVVVSDFRRASRLVSVTYSHDIQTTLESAFAEDISLLIATELKQAGVPARAVAGGKPKELLPNEVLLHGGVVVDLWRPVPPEDLGSVILMGGSLFIFGGILPSPLAFHSGAHVSYRLELVDRSGNILLQTGNQRSDAVYDNYYWPDNTRNRDQEKTSDMMPKVLVEAFLKSCNH